MTNKKIWVFIPLLMIMYGCGGSSSGGASSFTSTNSSPVIDNIIVKDYEQNVSSVVIEENGEYKIYVNENQKTAFTINATDKSHIVYSITGEDSDNFIEEIRSGDFKFKKLTDFERKKSYNFIIIADDRISPPTRKKATLYVTDDKNETARPIVKDTNVSFVKENESKYFITTWKTDNNATLHPKQITIPTFGDGYYYSVDWGDGTSSENIIEDITHTYKKAGTYQVRISGKFPRVYFAKGATNYGIPTTENNFKLISIDQWGEIEWSSMVGAFVGCVNLKGQASDKPDLSQVTDMYSMFYNAKSFNQNIGKWDVSKVTDMYAMFYGAKSFNKDIGNWNVSNVTNMSLMFYRAKSFNKDIGNWNVSNVTDMSAMFDGASTFNQDIGKWNVSNVTDMSFLFNKAVSFNQDIGGWDVLNVVSMDSLFSDATVFNQDISQWNVSNVEIMRWMFYGANDFDKYIGGWNVSNVTDMNSMFIQAVSFNQNISQWDVSSVTNFRRMFKYALSFNQNLESWKVSTNIVSPSFDGTYLYNREDMFTFAISMESLPTWFRDIFDTYIDHAIPLPQINGEKPFITTWKTDGENIISNTRSITIPTVLIKSDGETLFNYDYNVDWGDGTSTTGIQQDVTHYYEKAGTYKIKITGLFPRIHFGKDFYENAIDDNNIKLLSIDQWGDNKWTSMLGSFSGCMNLKIKATDNPNLSNVEDMGSMFSSASSLNSNIGDWDVSKVKYMDYMFKDAVNFHQDISTWNVSNVQWMNSMFDNASSFNKNLNSWDVSNVTTMSFMFYNTSVFNQDISMWNVSNVKTMNYMFSDASTFNQNLESWDVSGLKEKSFVGMFDRTSLDKYPSWYKPSYDNEVNSKIYKTRSLSKQKYFNLGS